ncbi:MAG: hypothetical protein ACP5VE_00045 [Chthonomonadales bacterium]
MQARRLLVVGGALCLGVASAALASAQNEAPFTIRRPPDGATVREKVRIEIPLASIPEGAYVAYSIDGQFRVAVAPTDEERARAKPGAQFIYIWDTKQPMQVRGSVEPKPVADGEHEISATLYVPKGGTSGGSVARQTTSVKVIVANKLNVDPGPILLRYKYPDATNRTYLRRGATSVVAGLTQGLGGTGEQELVAQKSKLLFAVEDVYPNDQAIVRNKIEELTVRQGGQETTYPSDELPQSLYQQVDPLGRVLYQNATFSFDQFAQLGIPVETTLELPLLPVEPKRIGDTWRTEGQRLDIPGTPPDKQPRVTLTSTLQDIEWQDGYPTAKIHQVYDSSSGGFKEKSLTFGTTEILSPQIKYERDIYLAYRSGTLVRVDRTLQVTGKTASAPVAGSLAGGVGGIPPGMTGGMMTGPYGAMGMGGPGGEGGEMPGMPGGAGQAGYMQYMRQYMQQGGYGPPGMPGAAGAYSGGGRRAGRRYGGMVSGPGRMMPGGPGFMPGYRGGMPSGGFTGPRQPEATSQITLKSTYVAELERKGED